LEARKLKQTHKVDLTKIDGDGDFSCPQCGMAISPEDPTEEKYSILKPKVKNNELEEVEILCNSCGSHIRLTGFSLLKEIA
jgi:transcription elongation factor Elf1